MRSNQKVCFVAGAGHSGSTLLGIVLGAHPSVFYAGEARKSLFLGDAQKPLKKRVCKFCGPDCPVWSDLRIPPGVDLYEALSRKTRRPIVVDSTKSVEWIEQKIAEVREVAALHLFFLVRDGRAVVNSRVRKYPGVPVREHARQWVAQITATEALAARFPGPVTRVRYEELASSPGPTIARLAAAIGIEPVPEMFDPWSSEQHPLGGNSGTQFLLAREKDGLRGPIELGDRTRSYYGTHPRAIVLDLRWKTEMSAEALAEFDEVAGETNQPYAWEGPST
jgi:hypothetical protein